MYLNSDKVSDVYFKLPDDFVEQYKGEQPDWGPIGYVTYKRTYARTKDNGTTEEWWETCQRVVEGTFTIQKRHCKLFSLPWYRNKALKTAREMYDRMFDFRWSPPGRGIWNMGMDYIYERSSAPLQNCAFRSTKNIDEDFRAPFRFLMNMSLLGVGVGGDVRGAGKVRIRDPKEYDGKYVVHDSREGWSNLISALIGSYARQNPKPVNVDYSEIREKGASIETFGGVAPGPEPLKKCYNTVEDLLERHKGEKISSGVIVDLFNIIGRAVVSGGLRRTAEIMLGSPNDDEFINLKDPEKHSDKLEEYRWASNNSIMVEDNNRQHYERVGDLIRKNGEPGVVWLNNCRNYGRMKDGYKGGVDGGVEGVNPCGEQTLEDGELCTLSESYPVNHDSLEDWKKTLKLSYLYGKSVTLAPTHNQRSNQIMQTNRRIGCSVTGITQAFTKFGKSNFFKACDEAYDKVQYWDKVYSDWLGVPRSIKTTSVKPSGTVSQLPGVTSGIHYPQSQYFIRNVRFQKTSDLLPYIEEAGYEIEEDKYSDDTVVVSFPVKQEYFDRSEDDVSMWEQFENTAKMQYYWSDNAVSTTVKFSDEEAEDIEEALELYGDRLKTLSLLPKEGHGYDQAPYIEISKEEYEEMVDNVEPVSNYSDEIDGKMHDREDKFCSGESCKVDLD